MTTGPLYASLVGLIDTIFEFLVDSFIPLLPVLSDSSTDAALGFLVTPAGVDVFVEVGKWIYLFSTLLPVDLTLLYSLFFLFLLLRVVLWAVMWAKRIIPLFG